MRLASLLTHLFVCLFVFCTVADFSAAERDRGVKFCMCISRQVFSPFGEVWLARSHGGGGISGQPGVGSSDRAHRHLWLQAGVGSADRAVIIYPYEGRWALGIAGGGVV